MGSRRDRWGVEGVGGEYSGQVGSRGDRWGVEGTGGE